MDALLLKIMKHRSYYEELMPDIEMETLHSVTWSVLNAFGKWFNKTTDEKIDIEEFKVYFFNFYKPNLTHSKKTYFNTLLEKCKEEATSEQTEFIVERLIAHTLATQVANLVDEFSDDKEIDIVQEIGNKHTQALERLTQTEDEPHVQTDIEEILDRDEYSIGIKFGTAALRDRIRPMQSGDLVLAAGRPDSGKTSFLSSQLVSFIQSAQDNSRPLLWFNNEGTGDRIVKRIYQSVLRATTRDLLQYRSEGTIKSRFQDICGSTDAIRVVDCHSWNSYQVEKVVKHYNPFLVIFDMIDNITFPTIRSDARTDQVLEAMYQWARVLGVKYDFPVIATSQISADAEQQTNSQCWPAQHMLKDSKTGKQGAADLIIMIGRNLNPDIPRNRRYISTPKNKLAIEESYIQAEVEFDAQRALYT